MNKTLLVFLILFLGVMGKYAYFLYERNKRMEEFREIGILHFPQFIGERKISSKPYYLEFGRTLSEGDILLYYSREYVKVEIRPNWSNVWMDITSYVPISSKEGDTGTWVRASKEANIEFYIAKGEDQKMSSHEN